MRTVSAGSGNLRVLDCKVPDCRSATENAPRPPIPLSPAARDHFACVTAGLQSVGIPFDLNPRASFAASVYCLTAFEVTCSHLGAQNAVRGRVDGMTALSNNSAVPPFRLLDLPVGLETNCLDDAGRRDCPSAPRIYVAPSAPKAVDVGCTPR